MAQLDLFSFIGLPAIPAISEAFPNNESEDVECKAARTAFPKDFWSTYSAFANTTGGVILLGIAEEDRMLRVEGLSEGQIAHYKKHFWDSVNNIQVVSTNLLGNEDVQTITVEDKMVLAFHIPEATRTQRPVYLTTNPFGNTYKRNHEGDYRLSKDAVQRMIADADPTTYPDSRILEGYTLDDLDTRSLKQYRQLFAADKPSHPWLTLDDKELLTKLGGYRKDRITRKEGFTVAGLLMFGKVESITDPECTPNFFPDYQHIDNRISNERWKDRICPDGSWEANLFQFYLRVWPKLAAGLPKPFQIQDGRRKDETPAHIALREAFVNALIHTDYAAPGHLNIVHEPEVFRFSNPGTLLISIRQYYEGGVSECRNKSLQKMFFMIGSAEKAGSGVSRIISGWEYAHWRQPYVMEQQQPERVLLELPMFSILPEDTLITLRKLFGEEVEALGKDELTILASCQIEGEISNTRLQYIIDLHRTDITKALQELCKKGYLLSDNRGRWTSYKLNQDFQVEVDTTVNSGLVSRVEVLGDRVNDRVNEGDDRVNEGDDRVNDRVGDKVTASVPEAIYQLIVSQPGIRVNKIAELVSKSTATVHRHLHTLKQGEKIVYMGSPRTGGYFSTNDKDDIKKQNSTKG